MGLGSWGSDKLQTLKGYINGDGSIMEGMTEQFTGVANELSSYYGIPITISDDGHVEADGVEYESLDTFSNEYTEKAEQKTITNYFDTYRYYCGVITNENSSADNFIKAICAASGADLHYSALAGYYSATTKDNTFGFEAHAATNEDKALIRLIGTSAGIQSPFIDIMGNITSSVGSYLKYFIYKGSTGDCYFKCFYSSDTTLPELDVAEDYFKDIHINAYEIVPGSEVLTYELKHKDTNTGGVAIIKFSSVISGIEDQPYDVVLFSTFGSPLVVGLTEENISSYDTSNQIFYRAITNNDALAATAAPIYSPTSDPYVSENSYWGIISIKDGYYTTNLGSQFGSSFVYDHGFMLRIY